MKQDPEAAAANKREGEEESKKPRIGKAISVFSEKEDRGQKPESAEAPETVDQFAAFGWLKLLAALRQIVECDVVTHA